jgi:DNA repair exonuclease SbcCD ATPase subunit
MSHQEPIRDTAEFEISNIGGIDHSTTSLQPGVNILTGENATNRTSFLQAIMAACGSQRATLKADAEQGEVSLTIDDERYTRTIVDQHGSLSFEGEPYLEDPTLADLFAFLLEDNEARQAIAMGHDLREIIMRPIDTSEIERKIEQLQRERDEIDEDLQHLETLENRLPELEKEHQRLEDNLTEKREDLVAKQEKIETMDATVEKTREEKEEYEETITELNQKRQEQQQVSRRIESERESIDSLENDRDELTDELADLDRVSEERLSEIDQEIQRLRGQIQQIDTTVTDLQSILQFNQEFLEDGTPTVVQEVNNTETTNKEITDQLVEDTESVVCWTCGSSVETDQIEATLNKLRGVRNEQMDERKSLQTRIEELQDEKSNLNNQKQSRENIEKKLAKTESEIDTRESKIKTLEEKEDVLTEEIDQLESKVESLENVSKDEILGLQKEVSQLEVEIDQLESDRDDLDDEINTITSQLDDREQLKQRREEISEELSELRTRVEDIQRNVIDEFNTHIETVLERLDYTNLDRIWIERIEEEVREGRRTVTKDRFKPHVVRSTESGTVYEDTVDHLSESEREVTGLIFALAGYLVHDVHEEVPFMLLDSIEAIDSERIGHLTDYFSEYTDYLVVALLEEDAEALDNDYPQITSI